MRQAVLYSNTKSIWSAKKDVPPAAQIFLCCRSNGMPSKQQFQPPGLPLYPENQTGCCALLKEDACTFYAQRPLICRTHGLPLLYLAEEYDESGGRVGDEAPDWQISWCDLNFNTVTEETMEEIFDPEDVLNMEEWNTILRELNQDFLETEEGSPFRGKKRISLKDLFTEGWL